MNSFGVSPHAARHVGESVLDVLVDAFDGVAPQQMDLQLLVDQLLDDLFARAGFWRRKLDELGALFDVEVRDRVAIDDGSDELRLGSPWHGQDGEQHQGEADAQAAQCDGEEGCRLHQNVPLPLIRAGLPAPSHGPVGLLLRVYPTDVPPKVRSETCSMTF